jgi:hypothetical protein
MRMRMRQDSRLNGGAFARWLAGAAAVLALAASGCSSTLTDFNPFSSGSPFGGPAEAPAAGPAPATIGLGGVRVGLLLPLSAPSSQSAQRRQLALAEFANPDIQLIVMTTAAPPRARRRGQAAAEGAEIVIGPLFSRRRYRGASHALP